MPANNPPSNQSNGEKNKNSPPDPIIRKDKKDADKKLEPASRPASFKENKDRAIGKITSMGPWALILVIIVGIALALLVYMALL